MRIISGNAKTGEILLNNELVAVVTREGISFVGGEELMASGWTNLGSGSSPITANTTKTVDEVAGVIAEALKLIVDLYGGGFWAGWVTDVITSIGRENLKKYVAYREGLMAHATLYQLVNTSGVVQYRVYWSLSDEY